MGTNGRLEEKERAAIRAMGESLRRSLDKIMLDTFDLAPPPLDHRTRLKVGDIVWMDKDSLVLPACDGRPGCVCKRMAVGKALARNGANLIASLDDTRGEFEFKVGPGLALDDLPDYAARSPRRGYAVLDDLDVDMIKRTDEFTFSNLLSPMKPLTADSILEAMKTMDAIKARDAETKKRYDDMVMSGLAGPTKRLRTFDEILAAPLPLPAVVPYVDRPPMRATIPDYGASGYRYQPVLDDRPWSHAPTKPIPKSEKEIYQLQKLNDGDRKRVELFPVIREGAPRTQSQSIAAGLGVWGTRGDAKLAPDPKPYPHVSDEDLLPDA